MESLLRLVRIDCKFLAAVTCRCRISSRTYPLEAPGALQLVSEVRLGFPWDSLIIALQAPVNRAFDSSLVEPYLLAKATRTFTTYRPQRAVSALAPAP